MNVRQGSQTVAQGDKVAGRTLVQADAGREALEVIDVFKRLAQGVAALVLIASFFAIRTQAAIGDSQFLRSMIPHHSGAVLMCKEATISDPEIKALCVGIIQSQEAEIAQMKALLERQ